MRLMEDPDHRQDLHEQEQEEEVSQFNSQSFDHVPDFQPYLN